MFKKSLLASAMALVFAAQEGAADANMPNLIVNGNFAANGKCLGDVGGTTISGWKVTAGNVDIGSGPCWNGMAAPVPGPESEYFPTLTYYVDLTGSYYAGSLSQTIATGPGDYYQLSFYFAGNPQWQYFPTLANDSPFKAMVVWINGKIAGAYSVTTLAWPINQADWQFEGIFFEATSTETTITFQSLNGAPMDGGSDFGPLLTGVVLVLD